MKIPLVAERKNNYILGPMWRGQAPSVGWRTAGTNRMAVGSLDSTHEGYMSTGFESG